MDRETALWLAVAIAITALSPRLMRWSSWPLRAGPRGLAIHVVAMTLLQFLVRQYLQPWAEQMERERQEMEERLGREVTPEEFGRLRRTAR